MLGSIRHEIRIRRSADDVWELVGDAARLHEWFPGIASSPVDGTSRVITTGAGLPMPEEILVDDPVQRRFQYRITAPDVPAPPRHDRRHRPRRRRRASSSYSTEADPRAMALVIGGATAGALDELRRQMETDPAADHVADRHAMGDG